MLVGCTIVTDRQTDGKTPAAIGRIAIAMPSSNGHNYRDIEDTRTEMLKGPCLTADTPVQGTAQTLLQ